MAIYKDKKRNTWYFRVYIKKDNKNIQKWKCGFKTKSVAKQAEIDFLNSNNYSLDCDIDMKFADLYDIYIKWKFQNLKPQSYRAITSRFNNHILPYFKDYKLKDINNRIYIEWKDSVLKNKFSYKYNASLHGCMVSILNYAIDFYGLDKNIASKVGNFSKKDYIPKVNFWTIEEFNQFISYVDDNVYYTLFHTLFFTGMRLGECLALNWTDIKEDYISINKTLAKGKINGDYVITTPKTSTSIRKVSIDLKTKELLKDLKNYYSKQINFNDKWFVFGGLFALSQTTIGRKKDVYCKKANVKRIKTHDFRHSHATFLLSRNIPITVISKRLGHRDIQMTLNVYSHFIPEDEDKAITLINNL